jgi:hypothetical protein
LKAGVKEMAMSMRRGLEAICGIVAGGLGLVTLVYVLFFLPAYAGSGSTCDSTGHCVDYQLSNQTVAQVNGAATLAPTIVVGVLLFVAIFAGALWDGLRDELPAKVLLWTATVLFTVGIFLAILSIGLFFTPVWLLAIMASILALTRARGQRSGMA